MCLEAVKSNEHKHWEWRLSVWKLGFVIFHLSFFFFVLLFVWLMNAGKCACTMGSLEINVCAYIWAVLRTMFGYISLGLQND